MNQSVQNSNISGFDKMSIFTTFQNRLAVPRLENHTFTQNRQSCSSTSSLGRFCEMFQNLSQKMTDFVKMKTSPYMRFKTI